MSIMTYAQLAQQLYDRRFDLTVDDTVRILTELHAQRTSLPHDDSMVHLHYELIEQCVDILFDSFAIHKLQQSVVVDMLRDIVSDWPRSDNSARAAIVSALNTLNQTHPIRAYLDEIDLVSSSDICSRIYDGANKV